MDQLELFARAELDEAAEATEVPDPVLPGNRKFIGSKYRLLPFLVDRIIEASGPIGVFVDLFAGTGSVAVAFAQHAGKVVANDLLYCNYIVNRAFLNSTSDNVSRDRLSTCVRQLNNMPPVEGYVHSHYGGRYFLQANAAKIDVIREQIQTWRDTGFCTEQEVAVLLTSLLFAMDKVANTVGQYDAYLKHLGNDSYDNIGRHLVDSNVYKPIRLRLPLYELDKGHQVYNQDANQLVRVVSGDVLYLDPPYNTRQYVDNYHVLENVMRWEKPLLSGKTMKFDRDQLKSKYSSKRAAAVALSDLICAAEAKHIFLSYSNEGIVPESDLHAILSERGEVKVHRHEYAVFGNGAGQSKKRAVTELLFHCEVRK